MTFALIIIAILIGTLIGAIGIGGVLLAPFLHYFQGIDLHLATAASSWSFLFTGIMGSFAYWRKGGINWHAIAWLSLGLIPGAWQGAKLNLQLSSNSLTIFIAGLILASAIYTILSPSSSERDIKQLQPYLLILIGLFTGFASALSGTGGPVILVPILLIFNVQAIPAIAASQVAQIPIALSAAIGFNSFAGQNLILGTSLGIVQSIGVFFGAAIAYRINPKLMRTVVSYALLIVVVIMLGRLFIASI